MRTLVLVAAFLTLFITCKSDSAKNSESTDAPKGKKMELSVLAADKVSSLKRECTSVDLISLRKNINVSMSFDNPQAISIILSFITDEVGDLTNLCTPDAHLVFQKNGEILQDLDLYYTNGCNALLFMDQQGKTIGANKVSNEGVDFFKNFLKNKSSQDTTGIRQ